MLHKNEFKDFSSYLIENNIKSSINGHTLNVSYYKLHPNKDGYLRLPSPLKYLETCFNHKVRVADYKFWILDKHKRKENHKIFLSKGYKLYRYKLRSSYCGELIYAAKPNNKHLHYRVIKPKLLLLPRSPHDEVTSDYLHKHYEEFNLYYL